jgi:hypothetical protein
MPCVLSIGGEKFDAITFLNETKLENAGSLNRNIEATTFSYDIIVPGFC